MYADALANAAPLNRDGQRVDVCGNRHALRGKTQTRRYALLPSAARQPRRTVRVRAMR